MKKRFLSLCVCTLLLASLLSGCNNQISLQTELNSSQVPVYLYQGNKNGVFFDRSKNNTTVTFIEEEPFSNTVTDTIFTFSTKLQTVSSHPFPHIDSFVDSTSQSVNVEVKKNLVNRVNLLFVNDSGIEYYLVPKEDYYEIVMWEKEQHELEVVSTVQVDSDHQPLIWNPLQLFSWKIFIHADSKQLCFLDLQSGKLRTTNSNNLPEQVYEGKDYLLFSSQNYSSYLLLEKTNGDLQPIDFSGKCICHNECNNTFGFFQKQDFIYFDASDPYSPNSIHISSYPIQKVFSQNKDNRMSFIAVSSSFLQSTSEEVLFIEQKEKNESFQQMYNLVLPNPNRRLLIQHKNSNGLGIILLDKAGLPGSLVWFDPWKELLHECVFQYPQSFQGSKVNISEVHSYLDSGLCWNMILADGTTETSWMPWFCEIDLSTLDKDK